jgi:hypothetical protein
MGGNTLMSLLVKLGVDTGDLDKGLGEAEEKGHSTAGKIVSGMSKIGAGVAAGLAGAAVATGAFLASTIGPASDLNETVSKVGVVFGDSAAQVLAFGKTAATNLGMSENAALSASGTFGNLFRSMQIGEKPATDMSLGMVQLASDLASFNNLDPTEVLDKLRAGITGEAEPLKTLGININQALLEQKALAMGLWDGVAPLDAAAKAQASYALMMEQTTLAQGDFARTSDGLANQQRSMSANFENVKATIGTALLPILVKLSGMLNKALSSPEFQAALQTIVAALGNFANWVITNIPVVVQTFQNIATWFMNNQPIVIGILAAIGVALLAFGINAAIAGAMAMAPLLPIIGIVMAIIAVVALLATAWTQNWGGIQEKVAAVWAFLQPIFSGIVDWFQTNIPAAIKVVSGYWTNVMLPNMMKVINWISTNLFPLFKAIATFLGAVFGLELKLLAAVWTNVLQPALMAVWDAISAKLMPIFDAIVKFMQDSVMPVLEDLGKLVNDTIVAAFEWLSGAIQAVIDWLTKMIDLINGIVLPDWLGGGGGGVNPEFVQTNSFNNAAIAQRATGMEPAQGGGVILYNYGTIIWPNENENVTGGLLRQLRSSG